MTEATSSAEVDDLLDRFLAAWDTRDPDRVAAFFAEDGIYAASVGPGPGKRTRGREAIRDLVAHMFALDAGARSEVLDRVPTETGTFWSWRYKLPDGLVELGCDLIIVRDGAITLKDAYRKVHGGEGDR